MLLPFGNGSRQMDILACPFYFKLSLISSWIEFNAQLSTAASWKTKTSNEADPWRRCTAAHIACAMLTLKYFFERRFPHLFGSFQRSTFVRKPSRLARRDVVCRQRNGSTEGRVGKNSQVRLANNTTNIAPSWQLFAGKGRNDGCRAFSGAHPSRQQWLPGFGQLAQSHYRNRGAWLQHAIQNSEPG